MLPRLKDPGLYAAALSLVAAKERDRQSDEPALAGAPSLASLLHEGHELSRRLADLVGTFRYELSPMTPRPVQIEGKSRLIFHSPPLDVVVMTALAMALGEVLENAFSDRLFSYRTGFSGNKALLSLSEFLKARRAAVLDVERRGLFVLRRDVRAYGDSIPSGPDSPLWEVLRSTLAAHNVRFDEAGWRWLIATIHPSCRSIEGVEVDPARGIPTGSPLQPLMGNLYLTVLDRQCQSRPGAFYARYGDDILFVHPDLEVAESVHKEMAQTLSKLELEWSADKCSDLYFSVAGRSCDSARYTPATQFMYLGARVDARGEVGLGSEKVTRLLRLTSLRLDGVAQVCAADSFDDRAEAYCATVNASLDPEHPAADRAAQLLRYLVTDRGQLKDLDYQIALRIAQRLTSVTGARAFRKVPIKVLKQRYGLRSLVVERNRVQRARSTHE